MEQIFKFRNCPRCWDKSYDQLETYGYCVNCAFNSEDGVTPATLVPAWIRKSVRRFQ